ncbi:MAG: hypothetical protein U9R36_01805 [Elusimicrobiota bacterium]|nr:hypothetical protein [Elusimicrobiota bacterium]
MVMIKPARLLFVINGNEYHLGHISIRRGKYKYIVWRQGDKLKEKYFGKSGSILKKEKGDKSI